MVVRIRFRRTVRSGPRSADKRLALVVAALLPPISLMAWLFAAWRIAADLNLASSFAISTGFFSHWQVWVGAAALLGTGAHLLNRYGKREDDVPDRRQRAF